MKRSLGDFVPGRSLAAIFMLGCVVPGAAKADPRPDLVAGPVFDSLGASVAVSGSTALVGAPGVNNGAGAAYVFGRQGTTWVLLSVLTDPRNVPGDGFGSALALVGATALVGAPGTRDESGAAYFYTRSGSAWHLRTAISDPRGTADDTFGGSVADVGTVAVIGAPSSFSSAPKAGGHAYVYALTGGRWHLKTALTDPGQATFDFFGSSVGVSGSTVVVGAYGEDGADGAAYIYARSGSAWVRQAAVIAPKGSGDSLGRSVAISGTIVLVGAEAANNVAGVAYVYVRSGSGWRLRTTLTPPAGDTSRYFGSIVALDGSSAVVGAFGGPLQSGQVSIYDHSGSTWRPRATLSDPGRLSADAFGISIALSGGTVLVGAFGSDISGAAYVYGVAGPRRLQATLTDPRGDPGNAEGGAVAISGNVAVVGAWGAGYRQSGAVYVYVRSAGRWRRVATLTDPAHAAHRYFGASVAVSGSTVLVGAPGGQHAYVYAQVGQRWRLTASLTGSLSSDYDFGASVAISGSTAVVGADDSRFAGEAGFPAGSAYVFVNSGGGWHRQATLADPRGFSSGLFGEAVALSGGTLLVSADGVRNFAGMVYAYSRSGPTWKLRGRLADPNRAPNDGFGSSVALSGATAVIGAPGVRDNAGAAYVYGWQGSAWRRQAVLTVPRRGSFVGGFGGAVTLSGTGRSIIALVSGLSVSGLASTRNRCGSAFEFARPAGRWRERARIADPQCLPYDEFGYALALSGRTGLIGAPGAHRNAGAAYLISLPGPG